jgi:glycosyltransferase involved in cell wall biosynthesis
MTATTGAGPAEEKSPTRPLPGEAGFEPRSPADSLRSPDALAGRAPLEPRSPAYSLRSPDALAGRGLRILAVTNMWPEGDSFRGIFVKEQVEALRHLGAHVDVEVVAQSRGRRDYLLAAPRIRRRVSSGNYDLVHIHHGMVALACRFIGPVPRVLGLYGHDVNWHWQRWITKMGWGGVAEKLYISRRMAIAAGDPDGVVIPNGVDFRLFAPADRSAARKRFGFAEDEKVILFGGVPGNWVKGYDVFTDVMGRLIERGLPVRELILPEPGQSREDVAPKFLAADVLLFTSRKGFEGSPTVVKEATAIGLPVVTTDVGDVGEVLSGVTPSAVVEYPEPWGTPQARAELVDQLTEQTAKALAAGTRSNGREQNAWLAWDRIAETMIDLYREVIARHRGTPGDRPTSRSARS